MDKPPLTQADLNRYTGSECYYRHTLNRRCVFTEGVHYLAEAAGAFWLIDAIILAQPYEDALKRTEFQCWTLAVREDLSAVLTCTNGNHVYVYSQDISITDFPLKSVELWFANNTLYLPSEH